MIGKALGPYKSTVILNEHTLTLVLSKENDDSELFATVTEKDVPHELKDTVESITGLSKLIEGINPEQTSVKDGRIFFTLTVDGKERTFSFQLSQRFSKEQSKNTEKQKNEFPTCANCQKWKEKVQILEAMIEKQRKMAHKDLIFMEERIKELQGQVLMKENPINHPKAELEKTQSAAAPQPAQLFPPTLKHTFLVPTLTSNFFVVTHNQIQLSNVPGLPKACLLVSDDAIPSTGKQTIVVKYLQTNQNARESSVCVGIMGSDRAKAKSAGGKGQKYSIGFWNKKDKKADYPTQVYEQTSTDKHGEVWVDGEIVVINKKLFVPMGEWIRMDVDIQAQQVEFITKEGSIVTRKFPKNYQGKQFYFFVRMADPKEKIEML